LNIFIEKRGSSRIDTLGEIRGLSIAKLIKQSNLLGSPKRRKKKKNVRTLPRIRRIQKMPSMASLVRTPKLF